MSERAILEIKLTGEGISPDKLRSKELAEVIESVENMIASTVVYKNPELAKDSIKVSLTGVKTGSAIYDFLPNLEELTIPAARDIANYINQPEAGSLTLSKDATSSLKKLCAFTKVFNKRHDDSNIEISIVNGTREKLATITPDTEIFEAYPFSGETTLYGEITRVGGKEPKIQFKTFDDRIIYCTTSREIAKKAGSMLYNIVGLHGLAEWDSETFEIESFHVYEISEYEDVSLSQAFQELSDAVGTSFDNLDVDDFISQIRYGLSSK